MTIEPTARDDFDATAITRPAPQLLSYYVLFACLTLVAAPFVLLPLWIRYTTLRYEIDSEGVSMSWGYFFRREILLTYRRVQDIHVRRNIIQRWLGLADVAIQTASGTAGAEMTIEGILEPEKLRDFLYSKMRGAKGLDVPPEGEDDSMTLLREIRDELRRLNDSAEPRA